MHDHGNCERCDAEEARLANLEKIVAKGLNAPSGKPICTCNSRAVRAGTERGCWYCELRAALFFGQRHAPMHDGNVSQ